jgi:hypothetical protein
MCPDVFFLSQVSLKVGYRADIAGLGRDAAQTICYGVTNDYRLLARTPAYQPTRIPEISLTQPIVRLPEESALPFSTTLLSLSHESSGKE